MWINRTGGGVSRGLQTQKESPPQATPLSTGSHCECHQFLDRGHLRWSRHYCCETVPPCRENVKSFTWRSEISFWHWNCCLINKPVNISILRTQCCIFTSILARYTDPIIYVEYTDDFTTSSHYLQATTTNETWKLDANPMIGGDVTHCSFYTIF